MSHLAANQSKPTVILIDGHSLAFRSYYAFAVSRQGALRTSTGIPTSICFGFLNSLLQVLSLEKPDYLAIAFDLAEPTFRKVADPSYKANRSETPEDFIPDLNNLQQLLTALNVSIATAPGYEADDVLGTIAQQAAQAGYQVKILSGDRDLFQLVDDRNNIQVLYLDPKIFKGAKKSYLEFDAQAVAEKLKITPSQVIDYKALCGDKSDNIPGVRGIGDKTAIKLLNEYQTLEAIYANIDNFKGAVKNKLEKGKQEAFHSQFLAKIALDAPIKTTVEDYKIKGFNPQQLLPLLKKLELKNIINNLDKLEEYLGVNVEINQTADLNNISDQDEQQLSLFTTDESGLSLNRDIIQQNETQITIKSQVITTEEQLEELIGILKDYTNLDRPVAWDTETTSLEPHNAKLVGIGCCWGQELTSIAYIPTGHTDGKQLDREQVIETLRPILENPKYPKAFQNTKFDRLVFHYQGINLAGVVFDTMLASYVLNPETTHNLTDLSERYALGIVAKSYKNLDIPKGKSIADLDIDTVANYCGIDAHVTYQLVGKLQAELNRYPELDKLLKDIEQPLEPVLADMENIGILLDTKYLHDFSQQLEKDLESIEQRTYEYAGEKFNLGSPKQLSEILFDKLNLNRKKSKKTKTGYSTNQAVLEKLKGDHPLIDEILEYRTLAKLKSTYVDALPALVRPQTNRVHTNFNQATTATGRLSSSNPNLPILVLKPDSRENLCAPIP